MRAGRHQFRRSSVPTSGARSACAGSTGSAASGPAPPSSARGYLPATLEVRTEGWATAAASTPSIAWIETRYGNVLRRCGRDRRTPAALAFFQRDRRRAGQGGMIEPLTEWLLVASPTKNQAAYEDFWGLLPGGRRSSPPTRTTRSVAPSPPRCRARTPRQDAAPPEHALASGTLAARCAADCPVRARRTRPARGGARIESSRPTGCAPHPRPPPDRRRGHRRGRVPSALTSTWSRTITPIGASWLRCACASPRSTPARSADRATRPSSSGWRGHR
jgi:hypothetical protein